MEREEIIKNEEQFQEENKQYEKKELSFKEKAKNLKPWLIAGGLLAVSAALGFGLGYWQTRSSTNIKMPNIDLKPLNTGYKKPDLNITSRTIPMKSTALIDKSSFDITAEKSQDISDMIPFSMPEDVISKEAIAVSEHLRKLPDGHHPSPEKVAEMISKGIETEGNMTIVDAYERAAS